MIFFLGNIFKRRHREHFRASLSQIQNFLGEREACPFTTRIGVGHIVNATSPLLPKLMRTLCAVERHLASKDAKEEKEMQYEKAMKQFSTAH